MAPGRARFLQPEGVVTQGPWFACSTVAAAAIRKWAKIEWEPVETPTGTRNPK